MCFCCAAETSDPSERAPLLASTDCAHSVSEIHLIDETGLGLRDTRVQCDFKDGTGLHNFTTDAGGRICLSKPIGTTVTIHMPDIHESKPGEAQTTPSGVHFAWRTP